MKNKNIVSFREHAKKWTLFEKIWLVLFTAINIYLFFAWNDSLIGLGASLTGMICVVLAAKGRISNYYFGIANVILYAYVAFSSQYYGEVMLNLLYYFPMQFIGIYYWKKNMNDEFVGEVKVKIMKLKERLLWIVACIGGIFGYGLVLKLLKGNLPFVDASSTVLSVLATVLMVRRVKEQWILWIAIDIISIYMWLDIFLKDGSNISMLVMWTAFLVNATYGLVNWIKMEKRQNGRK